MEKQESAAVAASRIYKRSFLTKVHRPKFSEPGTIFTEIHGIDFSMDFSNHDTRSWIEEKLSGYNRPIWETRSFTNNALHVTWVDVNDLDDTPVTEWCEDPDSELEILFAGDNEFAIQRDFVGSIRGEEIIIYTPKNFDDGFFNAFRWFLPRYLLRQKNLVMHSSCLVDDKGFSHLFVGPSGAGKTTTVSRATSQLILGDDMILLSFVNGEIFAETPVLGQNPKFSGHAGRRFPLKGIYFLKQGDVVGKKEISPIEKTKLFLTSVLYPTWAQSTTSELAQINELVKLFLKNVPACELTLDLKTPFLGVLND